MAKSSTAATSAAKESGSGSVRASRRRAQLAPVRGRRRPLVLAAAAILAVFGGLGALWLVGAAGDRKAVISVSRPVPYGATLTAADLTVAQVSVDGSVPVIPAGELGSLVGSTAQTNLTSGMLLTRESVGAAGEPRQGRVLVPLAVPPQRFPAGGLQAGDRLQVVDAEASNPGAGTAVAVTVVRIGATGVDGVTVVDVTTSPADGPRLAAAAAAGNVALVVQPAGG